MIIVLFSALATGGAVVVSQFLGAREQKSANKSAGQLILLSGILGLGVGVLCFVLARPMIRLFYGSIDADVLDAGTLYLKIIAVSYPFLALYNAGAALFRSMGNSRISMQISVLMNIINIVGNAVCIFGLKMGVDGVAWPSVVSRVVAAVLILGKCYQKGHALQVPRTVQLDVGMTRRILGIGIPSAFENSLFEAGRILVVSMISTFGTVQIAANAVANNLDGMGVIPGKALSLAMITVVGQCVGARDYEQAVHYTRKLTLWAYLTMGLFNGAILLFLRPLVGIYELSGATMELAIQLVTIHAGCAIFFWPLSFVLPNALRAANDVKFTMIVSILSMAVWRLGFSYLLCVRMGWGAVGVWIAMVIDWLCRVTCFVTRFRSGVWKTKYHVHKTKRGATLCRTGQDAGLAKPASAGRGTVLQIGLQLQAVGGQTLVQCITVAHAPLGEQEFLLHQLFQRHGVPGGQRMPGGRDEAHRLRYVHGPHQRRLQQGMVQRIGQVYLIGGQHLQHAVVSGGAEHQFHLRELRVVPLEQVGQKGAAHRVGQRDAQPPADLLGQLQGGLRLLHGGQQSAGVAQKGLTGTGQGHGLAHPVEQSGGTQFRFQLGLSWGGHRRLGVAQLPRCARKAVQLGNVQKGVDVAQFHSRLLSGG